MDYPNPRGWTDTHLLRTFHFRPFASIWAEYMKAKLRRQDHLGASQFENYEVEGLRDRRANKIQKSA
jgi:hypothetical protein